MATNHTRPKLGVPSELHGELLRDLLLIAVDQTAEQAVRVDAAKLVLPYIELRVTDEEAQKLRDEPMTLPVNEGQVDPTALNAQAVQDIAKEHLKIAVEETGRNIFDHLIQFAESEGPGTLDWSDLTRRDVIAWLENMKDDWETDGDDEEEDDE